VAASGVEGNLPHPQESADGIACLVVHPAVFHRVLSVPGAPRVAGNGVTIVTVIFVSEAAQDERMLYFQGHGRRVQWINTSSLICSGRARVLGLQGL
jgi:hypothetical protein